MNKKFFESLGVSLLGLILWMLSFISFIKQKNTNPSSNPSANGNNGGDLFFDFLKQFAIKGGLQHIFPGDDARDTSVQFELISQVNCTTSVGKPISLTVRNTPQSRRRLRLFNNFYNNNNSMNSNFYNNQATNYSSPYGNSPNTLNSSFGNSYPNTNSFY